MGGDKKEGKKRVKERIRLHYYFYYNESTTREELPIYLWEEDQTAFLEFRVKV